MAHRFNGTNTAATADAAQPITHQHGREIQKYGELIDLPIALEHAARRASVEKLNQILVDTMTLRDLYKKHHWQVTGPTFYQLHKLFDKHYEAQSELIDEIAERIQMLGGVSLAMGADVAETTQIPRPPRGREEVPTQISRLLEAHEIILKTARELSEEAGESGDTGTADLMDSSIIRVNEMQVWFVGSHLTETPLVQATE